MAFDTEELVQGPLHHRQVAHYHGDTVRVLFVIAAVVILLAETTGASLPLSMAGVVVFAVLLVIAAGLTNPTQIWIHYLNALLAIFGAFEFGLYAIEHYRASQQILESTFLYTELLALMFLVAVYYATKTVRGVMLRPHFN